MKHNVLFVDDEKLVLQGLQRALRPMRDEWEMTFVESGAAALAFMRSGSVDVIVSDMRMPGMNGAELLNEVMRRYPRTVRLVLSGHADQEMILNCVGSTHQYLSKPCDPDSLRRTVTRALDLETKLKSERIQSLVARMECLPSIPALYSELVDLMNQPEIQLEAVGQVISRDLNMTAQVLKLVNSAFFGLRREVASPAEAVAYLGLDTIKSLVLAIHTFSEFAPPAQSSFSMTTLWHHSLGIAAAAKRLAGLETGNRKVMDETFVAGLLHDAGKAALAFNFPDQYGEIQRQTQWTEPEILAAEQQAFAVDHADVGGYLLGLWGLPTPVVEAIALHHQPNLSDSDHFTPLTAVHVVDAFTHASAAMAPAVDLGYLDRLQLTDRLEVWHQDFQAQFTTARESL